MGTLNYKIINNFLEKDNFLKLQEYLFSKDILWNHLFYGHNKEIGKPGIGFYIYEIYKEYQPVSEIFNKFILNIMKKLKAISIIYVRANLIIHKNKEESCDWHVDNMGSNSKTAVFYMNNCNGYTVLKLNNNEEIKVSSEENKILIFDKDILHKVVGQTNIEKRIVLNINYYDHDN